MTTTTDTKGEKNRRKIVEAANLLFYQQGFNRTSFMDVAKRCEIPKGNFYFYFKSKDQLLTAVVEFKYQYIQAMLQQYEQEFDTPIERLKRLARMPLTEAGDIVRYGCPIGSLSTELAKSKQDEILETQKLFDLYVEWGIQQFKALKTQDDPEYLAKHMLSRMQGMITLTNLYSDKTFLEREVDGLIAWLDAIEVLRG